MVSLSSLNESTLLLISIGMSAVSGSIGFWLGIHSRIISNRVKVREDSVHTFINIIQSETNSIRMKRRPGESTNYDSIHAIISAYSIAKRHIEDKKKDALQLHWERYTNQIKSSHKQDNDSDDLGYRNYFLALENLEALIIYAENKWV